MSWDEGRREIARQSLEAQDGMIHELLPADSKERKVITESRNRRTANNKRYGLS